MARCRPRIEVGARALVPRHNIPRDGSLVHRRVSRGVPSHSIPRKWDSFVHLERPVSNKLPMSTNGATRNKTVETTVGGFRPPQPISRQTRRIRGGVVVWAVFPALDSQAHLDTCGPEVAARFAATFGRTTLHEGNGVVSQCVIDVLDRCERASTGNTVDLDRAETEVQDDAGPGIIDRHRN